VALKHRYIHSTLGNGYIPTSCLREILRELDDQLTSDELDMMIEEIDSDGSGTVDFDGKYPKQKYTFLELLCILVYICV
jgi:hypothetical protein